jgi:hypothetical protein
MSVEDAIAIGLERPSAAQRRTIVAQLARQLEARMFAAAGVATLDTRRGRKP